MLCYGKHFPVSISREIQFRTSRRHGYSWELKSGHRQLRSLLSVSFDVDRSLSTDKTANLINCDIGYLQFRPTCVSSCMASKSE